MTQPKYQTVIQWLSKCASCGTGVSRLFAKERAFLPVPQRSIVFTLVEIVPS